MDAAIFRDLANSLPEVEEKAHMGHPDFRVGGKIFATLSDEDRRAMVKLPPARQAELTASHPDVWQPAAGAWGRQGCTMIQLEDADEEQVWLALIDAWQKMAPASIANEWTFE